MPSRTSLTFNTRHSERMRFEYVKRMLSLPADRLVPLLNFFLHLDLFQYLACHFILIQTFHKNNGLAAIDNPLKFGLERFWFEPVGRTFQYLRKRIYLL